MEYPILAIDYGQKHIGIAISDAKGIVASPLEVIQVSKNNSIELVSKRLIEICKQYRVQSLLFGMPQAFEKEHEVNRVRIQKFIEEIIKEVKLPYTTYDESFSTSTAKDMIKDQGYKFKKKKSMIDSYAASVFLQEYLDNN
ncbi:MAG TPA: Holliday junction resolvase RuvX [Candidatus Dojkabacteria bacterium]|nr:Holliday junction resolvase RuvX [Candidatus Dojkabacteria bacterium]